MPFSPGNKSSSSFLYQLEMMAGALADTQVKCVAILKPRIDKKNYLILYLELEET